MSASTDPLDEELLEPVTPRARVAIVQQLWPDTGPLAYNEDRLVWDAYFDFYTRECNAILSGLSSREQSKTHRLLLAIVHLLLEETEKKKFETGERIDMLPPGYLAPSVTRAVWIDLVTLASRILTMTITVWPEQSQKSFPRTVIPWTQGSLRNAMHSYFNQSLEIPLDNNNGFIGPGLTFYNIERVSGIKMVPTDNLLDHLLLFDEDRKLYVFHHASFLRKMIATKRSGSQFEALDVALFPNAQEHTCGRCPGELAKCGHFPIGHFSRRYERYQFWRDRLIVLEEVVEDAMPPSSQLLSSLQKSNQQLSNSLLKAMNSKSDRWINSWFAIVAIGVTLFFGLVQSIEGAMQVYKAYHPEGDAS